ncbi:MAG TPA: Ku protein [Thermoanaerobaculia bacterium]|nr:Ku protein [Thermoanaerobaculia bacterium]
MAEEELDDALQPSGMRPFWSGTITFGLVTVPVALYAATRARGVALRMLGPDEAPVQRRYVCSKDGKALDADDIVRGYEIEKGKFVVVTDEELEAVEPRKSREIDLQLFVDVDDIDPMYYERAYYLVPAGGTNKAYRLLAEVMEKKKQAGIATFVMRAKEYMVAIIAENGILRAETLRFADEIRKPDDVGLPKKPKIGAADVKKIETQIARHAKKFDMRELLDDYTERLEKLVAKKEKKREDVVRVAEEKGAEEEGGGEVVDLMAVLSRSLQQGGRKAPKKAPASRKRSTSTSSKKK